MQDCNGAAAASLADGLAEALAALHGVSLTELGESVPVSDPGHLARLWSAVADGLKERLTSREWARVERWWSELLASEIPSFPLSTLAHGDPWFENLLTDGGRLTGILDWEYLSLSDPANDLGVTLEMGEAFFARVLSRYTDIVQREDPTLESRARTLWASRAFYGVEFSIVREDEEEWVDSLRSLRQGPILGT